MADSIDSPLMNIAPLSVERVGETKRKGESQNRKRSFPKLDETNADEENAEERSQPEADTYERAFEEKQKRKKIEAQSDKKKENPDGMGLMIDITV